MEELNTYIFFEEGNMQSPEFTIKARGLEEAYEEAYERYGPQVEDFFLSKSKVTYKMKDLQKDIREAISLTISWYQGRYNNDKKTNPETLDIELRKRFEHIQQYPIIDLQNIIEKWEAYLEGFDKELEVLPFGDARQVISVRRAELNRRITELKSLM